MRECKNFPGVTCERSCSLYGQCAESVRRPAAHRHEPPPIRNAQPAVQDLVIADIEARKQVGIEKYGTVLQAFNGRCSTMDAYQESIDMTIYLRQRLVEESSLVNALRDLLDIVDQAGWTADSRVRAAQEVYRAATVRRAPGRS